MARAGRKPSAGAKRRQTTRAGQGRNAEDTGTTELRAHKIWATKRADLPMATTTLNIVMRTGGPTLTTICATFLGWRLAVQATTPVPHAYGAAFALLCGFHLILCLAAMRLPRRVGKAPAETASPRR